LIINIVVKNSDGIPASERKLLMSKSLEFLGNDFGFLVALPPFIVEAAQTPYSGS